MASGLRGNNFYGAPLLKQLRSQLKKKRRLGANALRMIPLMVRVMRNETRIRTWLGTVCQYAEMVAQGSARNEERAFMMGA